jgi:hypothetical protein
MNFLKKNSDAKNFKIKDLFAIEENDIINNPNLEKLNIIINFLSNNEANALIKYIADPYPYAEINSNNDLFLSYGLNLDKIKLFCFKSILYDLEAKMKLSVFIELFKNSLRIILPSDLLEIENRNNFDYLEINNNECEDNLFEYYKGYDLRFLKNYAYVYFISSQREPLLRYIIIVI